MKFLRTYGMYTALLLSTVFCVALARAEKDLECHGSKITYYGNFVCYKPNQQTLLIIENIGSNPFNAYCDNTDFCTRKNIVPHQSTRIELAKNQELKLERVSNIKELISKLDLDARITILKSVD